MSVLPIPISREKNCRLELNVLPSNQTGLATVGSIVLSQKTIPGHFAAKILKTRRAKQKNKTKARGELFASSFPNFDSRETHADLTNQLLANRVMNFAHAR